MIKKNSTIEAWKNAMRYVLQEGKDFVDKDGRKCRETTDLIIEIKKPLNDITAPIEKVSSSRKWVYPRTDEIANITMARKFSPGHIYIYGQRIFNFDGSVNQIDKFVIPLLRKDEKTRRAVISLWNPKIDANMYNKEVPSIMLVSFVLRENKLDASAVIRSNDIFFGWPANIYQIYLLQDYVSQHLNKDTGKITVNLLNAHIFEDQFEDARSVIS